MAGIEKLTDKTIQATLKAVAAAGKAKILSDGGGLQLEARPTGARWWRLRYTFNGTENRQSLGTYPEVTLANARQRRRDDWR